MTNLKMDTFPGLARKLPAVLQEQSRLNLTSSGQSLTREDRVINLICWASSQSFRPPLISAVLYL